MGTVVMPQRGRSWNDFGWSNALVARLEAGAHSFRLSFEAEDENMNRTSNRAMVDYLEAIRIE